MIEPKVLRKINELEEVHCRDCTDVKATGKCNEKFKICDACPIGQELQILGQRILMKNTDHLLSKGPDMTFSNVLSLLDSGVLIKDVVSALELTKKSFKTYMNRHGYNTKGDKLPRRKANA